MTMKTLPRGSGQQTADDSAPVVLASGSIIPLPTGAATEVTSAAILVDTNALVIDVDAMATDIDAIAVDIDAIATDVDTIAISIATINSKIAGSLVNVPIDEVTPDYSNATKDIYVYKLLTATVKTVTVDYSDATKTVITNVKAV